MLADGLFSQKAVGWLNKNDFHVFSASKFGPVQVIQAIRFRLLSPDVLNRGWVLDDFPCTKAQAGNWLGAEPAQQMVATLLGHFGLQPQQMDGSPWSVDTILNLASVTFGLQLGITRPKNLSITETVVYISSGPHMPFASGCIIQMVEQSIWI